MSAKYEGPLFSITNKSAVGEISKFWINYAVQYSTPCFYYQHNSVSRVQFFLQGKTKHNISYYISNCKRLRASTNTIALWTDNNNALCNQDYLETSYVQSSARVVVQTR